MKANVKYARGDMLVVKNYNISRYVSIKDKLEDKGYIGSLSDKMKGELKICIEMLTDEELSYYSSISTAYKVARERYIEKYFDEEDRPNVFVRYNSNK